MNDDVLAGRWREMKVQLKARWGRISDDDLARVDGRSEQLAGVLQRRYGLAREQAEKDGQAFLDACDFKTDAPAGGCRPSRSARTERIPSFRTE